MTKQLVFTDAELNRKSALRAGFISSRPLTRGDSRGAVPPVFTFPY